MNQIIKSVTFVGANIHEAYYTSSKADALYRSQRMQQNGTRLEILIGANAISEQVSKELLQECGIVWRMLIKSITTTKEKK